MSPKGAQYYPDQLFYFKVSFQISNDLPDDWRIVFTFENAKVETASRFFFTSEFLDLKGYEE